MWKGAGDTFASALLSGAAMGLSPPISCSPLTPLMLPLVPQVPFGVHIMSTRSVVQALRLWHAIEVSPSLPTHASRVFFKSHSM